MKLSIQELAAAPPDLVELMHASPLDPELEVELVLEREHEVEQLDAIDHAFVLAATARALRLAVAAIPDACAPAEQVADGALSDPWFDSFDETAEYPDEPPVDREHPLRRITRWLIPARRAA